MYLKKIYNLILLEFFSKAGGLEGLQNVTDGKDVYCVRCCVWLHMAKMRRNLRASQQGILDSQDRYSANLRNKKYLFLEANPLTFLI